MSSGIDRKGARRPTGYGPRDRTLQSYPPIERWNDWTEYDPARWPERVPRAYMLVPTVCFNCESGCGLTAFVDQQTLEIRKLEGNPYHPASRGRNCAKGPATVDQVNDPERILYPLRRRSGSPRGGGEWERVSWDHVLDTFAERMHEAFAAGRPNDVEYFVGRPGEDGFADRFLETWGCDGHNSHTNVCSSGGRAGYAFWTGTDRPSNDFANAKFILLISAHLESGHTFNPHAQRITEARHRGARVAVIDPRLSNTATTADYWLPAWPGTEGALLLAIAKLLIDEDWVDRDFIGRWVNWRTYLAHRAPGAEPSVQRFLEELSAEYGRFTPEFAEAETGVPAQTIRQLAREIAQAGSRFCAHIWRAAAAGNLHGWQVTRALVLLNALTGSIGTEGGMSPNAWDKFVPAPWRRPEPNRRWNEINWPREFPLSCNEMSILYPHFLLDERATQPVLFTRVLNPVWTFPDGGSWISVLRDEGKVGLHGALTPTWSETAWWADYVLPMGHAPERHDTMSYETHAGRWLGFRQPVRRVAMERMGQPVQFTYEANPGEVWEEGEFWIEVSWRADPDGSLGIRRYYESPYRPGEKITIAEFYRWMFENSVPGLPEKAAAEGLEPLEYMRRYGVVEISRDDYHHQEDEVTEGLEDTAPVGVERTRRRRTPSDGHMPLAGDPDTVGVEVDGRVLRGFSTTTGKLELYSETLEDWGWPEFAVPTYARTHVHHSLIDHARAEYLLVPTFRLPTLVHTRSGNAKHLTELAHAHPLLVHPVDAERMGVATNDLLRVETEIGYFVIKALVTEGIRPGVIAASHHMGRWRLRENDSGERWSTALVDMRQEGDVLSFRRVHGVEPFASEDPSSERIWWSDAGVHQNITFPVHPDPLSGMHCWHQKVRAAPAREGDRYGDTWIDLARSREVYRKWMGLTRPATGEQRRPLWMFRQVKPARSAYALPRDGRTEELRRRAQTRRPLAPDEMAGAVDWSPLEVWGPLPESGG
ncbi:MAG TPA: molybdopterin-dependent oxidoreductase [Solirubrobacteraceae bacterium]|nr:molybdopterin-dependent oxidoreductase [Solirubrobacteraceae bacterium]